MTTDPTLIAQIGRALADIATRPYEPGMLQALAYDRLTDTRPPLPRRLPGLTLAATGNWRCPDCDTWNADSDRACHCCGN